MIIRTINDKHTLGSYCLVRFEGRLSFLRVLFEALISFVLLINDCGTISYFSCTNDRYLLPTFALF